MVHLIRNRTNVGFPELKFGSKDIRNGFLDIWADGFDKHYYSIQVSLCNILKCHGYVAVLWILLFSNTDW